MQNHTKSVSSPVPVKANTPRARHAFAALGILAAVGLVTWLALPEIAFAPEEGGCDPICIDIGSGGFNISILDRLRGLFEGGWFSASWFRF